MLRHPRPFFVCPGQYKLTEIDFCFLHLPRRIARIGLLATRVTHRPFRFLFSMSLHITMSMKVEINSERWMNPQRFSRERWRGLSFLPKNYKVSDFGRVKKKVGKSYKILYSTDNGRNYYAVSILHKKYYIHRLVAFAFIPNPNNYPEIDHIGDKLDNRAINLRWATRKINMNNPRTIERRVKFVYSKQMIMIEQVDMFGRVISTWPSIKDAATRLGISHQSLARISKVFGWIGEYRYRRVCQST